MRVKNVVSKRIVTIVKLLYFLFGMCVALPLLLIISTEGGVKEVLINYSKFSLFLAIIPLYTSTIGFYHFFFTDDQYIVKIHAKCVALGNYYSKFNKIIELPRDHFVSYRENHSFFGLKKELYVEFIIHNMKRRQKFNISMLTNKEHGLLRKYLDKIIENNKRAKV